MSIASSTDGLPPGERVQRSLIQARRDLLDPRLAGRPIASIACACGFGDLSGFNRAFKEAYGVSPKELRPRKPRPGQVPPGAASDTKARSAKSS